MRTLSPTVLTFLALALSCARGEAACAPYSAPITLDFQTTPVPRVSVNNTLNITGLRNLMQQRGQRSSAGVHAEALGVTFTTPAFGLEAKTRIEPFGDTACVYLSSLQVTFGYRDMNVYVASEYPPGSCEYRAILDHENQHVAINTAALSDHAPRLRLALERILGEERPLQTRNPRGATRQVLDRISQRAQEPLAAYYRQLDERNGIIDNQANYDAVAGVCTEWSRGNVWPSQQKPKP